MSASQIPNLLTGLRVLLAAVTPLSPFECHAWIVSGALLTEFLDGFFARRFGWESRFGEIADPVADKLFFFSLALTWVSLDKLSWADLALLGLRDILLVAAAFLLFPAGRGSIRPVKARPLGKITTGLQYFAFLSVLIQGRLPIFLPASTALCGFVAAVQYGFLVRAHARGAGV